MQILKVPESNISDNLNPYRKEKHFWKSLQLYQLNPNRSNYILHSCLIEVRWYYPNEICYCCVWFIDNRKGLFCHTGGKASGYGYDKLSASFSQAVRKLGFTFNEGISAAGQLAVEEAIKAIAEQYYNLTPNQYLISISHG